MCVLSINLMLFWCSGGPPSEQAACQLAGQPAGQGSDLISRRRPKHFLSLRSEKKVSYECHLGILERFVYYHFAVFLCGRQSRTCMSENASIGSDSRNIGSPANAWFPLFYQRFWWFPGNRSLSNNRSFCREHQMGIMQNCSCGTFIFPRVFNISSWKRDLLHKTSTAHWRSTRTVHCHGNAEFALFSHCF